MQIAVKPFIALLMILIPWLISAPKGLAAQEPLKIIAFGTSLTARGGWPDALEKNLQRCLNRPVTVETIALGGATSDWGAGQIDRLIAQAPNIVLIEFYANDAAIHRFFTLRRSRENLAKMLDAILQKLPEARIFVMAMNPVSGLRRAIRPFLNSYVTAHRDLAWMKGINFIDHRPAWRQLSDGALAEAIPDGLHPRPEKAAEIIVPLLVSRITEDKCPHAVSSVMEDAGSVRNMRCDQAKDACRQIRFINMGRQ